ncbi:MAG: DUF2461 domain-containing protein [Oscillospiraceae bacterium]|nr:DUF2461 domain-containing protein [Oscillospiraceae bacterium]
MSFSAKSLDFLFENSLNDSKAWFNEHKEDYKKYVVEPFSELIGRIAPVMLEIDEEFVCDPRKLSRLYRDARYAKGKSIFRDYVWYTFSRPVSEKRAVPGYYFSISPNGFDYGCGFYCADSSTMAAARKLILADDKSFKQALSAYKKQDTFELYGELYKRDHYPDETAEKRDWLNRKALGVCCESKEFGLLFSDGLADKVAEDFRSIAPVYKFFTAAAAAKQ